MSPTPASHMGTCEHFSPVLVRARQVLSAVTPITVRASATGHNVGVTTWLLLHGAGSTPHFIARAFGPAADRMGVRLVAPDVSGATMPEMVELIAGFEPSDRDVIGGVSLGAHASAEYAATSGFRGRLYAVMPAWLGEPEDVAGLTSSTADWLAATSVDSVLAEIAAGDPGDWIVHELQMAWTSMDPARLIDALRVAGSQQAPTPADLATITCQTRVVGLADDPTHPLHVARTWATSVADGRLQVLPRDLAGRGPGALSEPLLEWLRAADV